MTIKNHIKAVIGGFFCVLVMFCQSGFSETVFLQNGVNGYEGCSDSTIPYGEYGDHHQSTLASASTLLVNLEHFYR